MSEQPKRAFLNSIRTEDKAQITSTPSCANDRLRESFTAKSLGKRVAVSGKGGVSWNGCDTENRSASIYETERRAWNGATRPKHFVRWKID